MHLLLQMNLLREMDQTTARWSTNASFEGLPQMNSAPLRWASLAPKYSFTPLAGHPLPRGLTARLRRKRPSWGVLALLVVAVDFLLASLAWGAIDFVLQ
jgi:hypothetical protein